MQQEEEGYEYVPCKKRGQGSEWVGNYKFYWKGQKVQRSRPPRKGKTPKNEVAKKEFAEAGVGILVEEELTKSILGVNYKSERLMIMKLDMDGRMLHVISAYAPQTGRPVADKDAFWNEFYEEIRKIPEDEMIWFGGDLNGHIGREVGGYETVHGYGVGYGERNADGQRILEFCGSPEKNIG